MALERNKKGQFKKRKTEGPKDHLKNAPVARKKPKLGKTRNGLPRDGAEQNRHI